ncbi:MAG: sigma-70 family RNA polymerase sigma factor [Nocardioidaceae bacterium]
MVSATAPGASLPQSPDAESAEWLRDLRDEGAAYDDCLTRLHGLLIRGAHRELQRRSGTFPVSGPELEDLAHQAAGDAMVAVLAKVDQFRGESRFTTWAYRFVVLEVSNKVARHFWRNGDVEIAAEDWNRIPDTFALPPDRETERRELVDAVRHAVSEALTERQRRVFIALVLNGVPPEALAVRIGTTRNAIYKTMFDARRKIRADLVANGYLDEQTARGS